MTLEIETDIPQEDDKFSPSLYYLLVRCLSERVCRIIPLSKADSRMIGNYGEYAFDLTTTIYDDDGNFISESEPKHFIGIGDIMSNN